MRHQGGLRLGLSHRQGRLVLDRRSRNLHCFHRRMAVGHTVAVVVGLWGRAGFLVGDKESEIAVGHHIAVVAVVVGKKIGRLEDRSLVMEGIDFVEERSLDVEEEERSSLEAGDMEIDRLVGRSWVVGDIALGVPAEDSLAGRLRNSRYLTL